MTDEIKGPNGDETIVMGDGEAENAVMTIGDCPPEEFYAQPDSIYIRLRYFPEAQGYKFEIFNQLIHNLKDGEDLDQGAWMMGTLARGALQMLINAPTEVYNIGMVAERRDYIHNSEEFTEEQKALFNAEIKGRA